MEIREDSEGCLSCLKATLEYADIRFAEIKKAAYEFERDIVRGAINQVGPVT